MLTKVSSYVLWQTKYGKDLEFLQKIHEDNQHDPNWITPSAIREMPELAFWEMVYVKAFYILSGSRQLGMSVGPIQLSEIYIYCQMFNEPDIELITYVIQKCDSVYLEEYNKQQESKQRK